MTYSVNYDIEIIAAQSFTETDWEQCLEIEQASFEEAWSPTLFKETIDESRTVFFVLRAIEDSKICGFACYSTVCDEAELLQICVTLDRRRLGLGRVLLHKSLSDLKHKGFKHFFLEVRASNVNAIKLYRQLGFTEDAIRHGYYRATQNLPAEDAIMMSLHY